MNGEKGKDPNDIIVGIDPIVGIATGGVENEGGAEVYLRQMLDVYGLDHSLIDVLKTYVSQDLTMQEAITRLKGTPQFEERFAGMQMRRDKGLNVPSIDEYLQLENSYKQAFKLYGIPDNFLGKDDFDTLIGNDVSPSEVEERAEMAAQAVSEVDPNLKAELANLYGIGGGIDGKGEDLMAYFIDPDRAISFFETKKQFSSAMISSAAIDATSTSTYKALDKERLTKEVAERLASENYQAMQISRELSPKAGLTQSTLSSEGVSVSDLASSTFGLDQNSVAMVKRLQQKRSNVRQRGAGGLMAQQGATGLGSAQN